MKQMKKFVEIMIIRLVLILLVETVFTAYDKARTGQWNFRKYLTIAVRLMDEV